MPETNGKAILIQLQKSWMRKALLSRFLLALSITIVTAIFLYKIFSLSLYSAIPLAIFLFLIIVLLNRSWRLNEASVSGFLNRSSPPLQESAHLFLLPQQSLSLLQKLQLKRVEGELLSLKAPDPFQKQFTASLIALLTAFIISAALFFLPLRIGPSTGSLNGNKASSITPIPEKLLPEIRSASVVISPPAYTGKGSRQSGFNLSAEEGAVVSWQLHTNITAKKVELIFNDGTAASLTTDAAHQNWRAQKQFRTSGFYQVKIDGKLSDLYKIEVVRDHPPTITIQSPAPTTSIPYGQTENVLLKTTLADDYGIISAQISATISSGQGEAVKFKEQRLSFDNFRAGGNNYHLQKTIDCKALGMAPGDELYFFITASDNHNQQTASEVYIITLQDTANLLSIDGIVTSLDVKQEFFRSQRQIIIETEQLLKKRPAISAEQFKNKSNDLGIDQQLLRLRYGKFLGEETNIEIGEGHEEEHGQQGYTNNADEIIDQYSHKHDIADDADFFDPATKKQLKKMLDEMWNAEIKLRTFLPKEALVYENKALLLLKDLQQKSRAYVPKTGFTSTPLKLDKRLTGDLSKIGQPLTKETIEKPESETTITRKALGILESLKESAGINEASKQLLQQAFGQLSKVAASQSSVYLPALSSLKKIVNDTYSAKDIRAAEAGLQKLLPVAEGLPYAIGTSTNGLSKQYFLNISKGGRQ